MKDFFIAGGTSELGNRVVRALVEIYSKDAITCLHRRDSEIKPLEELGVRLVEGDVCIPATYKAHLSRDIIYIDMTHPKYYHSSIEIIKEAEIQRAFFVTTTGIFSQYNHCSDIYIQGENKIKASSCTYTILRPSMIYGTNRDRNMTKLLGYLAKWPVFPVFGQGDCLMQPVYVQDLADGIVSAIKNEELTRNKEYNLCGPTAMPYSQILRLACEALGRKVRLVRVPYRLALFGATVGEKVIPKFPIKKEQVQRLVEDKCFDISEACADLNFSPREFSAGIKEEVVQLRLLNIIR